jgi:chlorophyllide a oxygenase
MPSTAFCRGVKVASLPVGEVDGLLWVWPGWRAPGAVPAGVAAPPPGYAVHAEIELEVPVEHGLLLENLLDLAHAPFTHTSTFAKGWPVPEAVHFQAARVLGGNWQPYPIAMEFGPPCMVLSTIGLAQPGKIERGARADDCRNHLHQLHVCLPARPGHTRLLYRMSMDFMGWARWVPGVQAFWRSIAGQVLGEDLVLVEGQQARMAQGGDTWARPVSYDKLAVRYRRWRNGVAAGAAAGEAGGGEGGGGGAPQEGPLLMSAGELFALDEESDDDVFIDLHPQGGSFSEEEGAEGEESAAQ